MKTEIEAKFLDIDKEVIREHLAQLGATLVYPEGTTRQKVFDFPDFKLDQQASWLRLREENGEVSLTLKKWAQEGIEGMKEIAFTVSSFESAEQLLLAIGMKVKSSQTKKRELWRLGTTEYMIDTWPWVPAFIEIEGQSEEEVQMAAVNLGLDWSGAMFGGVARIYKKYFAIKNEDIDRCPNIDFVDTPEWLEKKRLAHA
jgi:adenylate cyclase class 2